MDPPIVDGAAEAFVPPTKSSDPTDAKDGNGTEHHFAVIIIVLPAVLLGILFLALIASDIKLNARLRRRFRAPTTSRRYRDPQERRIENEPCLPLHIEQSLAPPSPSYHSLYCDRPMPGAGVMELHTIAALHPEVAPRDLTTGR